VEPVVNVDRLTPIIFVPHFSTANQGIKSGPNSQQHLEAQICRGIAVRVILCGRSGRLTCVKEIEPSFGYQLDGYNYLGRGSGGGGWSRRPDLYYRCAQCGDMMQASFDDYFSCNCKAMHVDIDAGRFGSQYGDQNILRYEKVFVEKR